MGSLLWPQATSQGCFMGLCWEWPAEGNWIEDVFKCNRQVILPFGILTITIRTPYPVLARPSRSDACFSAHGRHASPLTIFLLKSNCMPSVSGQDKVKLVPIAGRLDMRSVSTYPLLSLPLVARQCKKPYQRGR